MNARHFYGMSKIRKHCSEIKIGKQNETTNNHGKSVFLEPKCKKDKLVFTSHSI